MKQALGLMADGYLRGFGWGCGLATAFFLYAAIKAAIV